MRVVNRTGRAIAMRVEQPGQMIVRMDLPSGAEWDLPHSEELPPLDPEDTEGIPPEEVEELLQSRKRVAVMLIFNNDDFASDVGVELHEAAPERLGRA